MAKLSRSRKLTTPKRHAIDRRARGLIPTIEGFAPDSLFTAAALAELIGVSEQFLDTGRMRRYAYGPAFLRIGAAVFYKRDDVIAWLQKRAGVFEAQRQKEKQAEPRMLHIIRAGAAP